MKHRSKTAMALAKPQSGKGLNPAPSDTPGRGGDTKGRATPA